MVVISDTVLNRIRQSALESSAHGLRVFGFKAMGTWCQLMFAAPSRSAGDYFAQEAMRWVADFEARYSRFLPESLISAVNQAAGRSWIEIDPETEQLLSFCNQIHFHTRGAFDPTALPLQQLWDWKAKPERIPEDGAIRNAQDLVGWCKVQRKPGAIFLPRPGMSLDLGGIGKEYAVDRVMQLGQEHGIASLLVDFGQDLRVWGLPPDKPAWHIGLEDPKQPGQCWTSLGVKDRAVASSGDYLRHFKVDGRRYGHIIDPRTGYPVDNGCLSVSVIAASCTVAGILSTSAFILGAEEGLRLIENHFGAAGCITTETRRHQTRNFYEYIVP